ncbi:hypothetical protein VP01_389g2 [Puccinia sorghi]|uniref:Uncharacterized protein n=1 Tax=Puccinia sorghi TaxID=27349 RepID=A0A0L6UTK3_9BASI|nr:hypothetical protein VP01_389g2 [Puccinia sorghi]
MTHFYSYWWWLVPFFLSSPPHFKGYLLGIIYRYRQIFVALKDELEIILTIAIAGLKFEGRVAFQAALEILFSTNSISRNLDLMGKFLPSKHKHKQNYLDQWKITPKILAQPIRNLTFFHDEIAPPQSDVAYSWEQWALLMPSRAVPKAYKSQFFEEHLCISPMTVVHEERSNEKGSINIFLIVINRAPKFKKAIKMCLPLSLKPSHQIRYHRRRTNKKSETSAETRHSADAKKVARSRREVSFLSPTGPFPAQPLR